MILLIAGLVALALYLAFVFTMQRRLMYPRPPVPPFSVAEGVEGLEVLRLGPDENVEAWYLPPLAGSGPTAALIFTHGNGELIDYWAEEFQVVGEWGVAVLLVEYPGYGRSGGSPSQESITRTMLAAYDALVARPEIDPARIVAYGRSLGGGAACALARQRQVAALILESTFTGVRPLARRAGVPGWLVLDPFDNLATVSEFEGPILVIHGDRDRIVPADNGRRLHEAASNSELHLLPCGHNDCPRPWARVERFLEESGLFSVED